MTGPDPTAESPDGLSISDLETAILGEAPTMRAGEVAEAAGVSGDDARRLWRALGFPDAGDQPAFNSADREALELVTRTVSDSGIDFETMLRLTRAIGHTVSRLADWQMATVSTALEEFASGDLSSPEALQTALDLVENQVPNFDQLLVYAWRRHLAAAVSRIEVLGANDDDLHVPQATVGFADLVSFTALSNELDEHEIGELVEVFETRCSDVIADHNGRVIKTLGDSVLFMEADPVQAIDIALDIIGVIGGDERLPDVRLGLATGPVVLRMGDVYGPPVNLAARFTTVARRNRVIIDQRTAELLPAVAFETRPLPARPIRGFGDLEPFTVRRTRPRH
ncbi:adenylate/guanylate cyclase domain-containing protein [Nocardioides marmoriginsengisoli]|uniref:Adenylate/guanylate cyclase domain-containing protein n=1 Tax=Nocardioides marmoriginsengisoli TaxID=661483 RepID=A0A3N0CHX3_9ACTN|nr:adenylate/guanylate cyclase domain-containing protein [Nocardioides marmoriginsengisoli]RNL63020.1 adenylate/guanylate cyclase domain-containing protein [Nocardioides marmoriginsengisoli]